VAGVHNIMQLTAMIVLCGCTAYQLQDMERKKAYAAELQAQMQDKERQRQQDRMQRLGYVVQGVSKQDACGGSSMFFALPIHPASHACLCCTCMELDAAEACR
jgi:hypothetical protein